MARRAPAGEDDGAAGPVGGEEAGGRTSSAKTTDPGGIIRMPAPVKRVEDPVADVLEIGRPGAEILVLGGLVARDLPSSAPRQA